MKSNRSERKFRTGAILLVLFVLFTAVVRWVDVQPIGPEGSSVGLAAVNGFVFGLLGESALWYKLTSIIGCFALLCAALFGLTGLIQWIRRRSLRKVNHRLLALAGFYVVVAAFYVLFEKLVVNCRPVLEDGALAASYPSSHTMLSICIFASGAMILPSLTHNRIPKGPAYAAAALLSAVMAVGRLLAGVHWFTDVCGAVLLSAALVELYGGCIALIGARIRRRKRARRRA